MSDPRKRRIGAATACKSASMFRIDSCSDELDKHYFNPFPSHALDKSWHADPSVCTPTTCPKVFKKLARAE